MKKRRCKQKKRGGESGIALFMVISAVALLAVLTAELTYSTQVNSRMAYNAVDNLKAYYLAKAAYRFSLLRLMAYASITNYLNDPKNKSIKSVANQYVDQIWQMPVVFPPPLPKDAPPSVADPINKFVKESSLSGHYATFIFSESAKINLNNLFNTQPASSQQQASSSTPAATPTPTPQQNGQAAANFQPVIADTITELLSQKRTADADFAETYRDVTGQDVSDAIMAYVKGGMLNSNLPGFKPIENPKNGPLYSLSELHMIPGIDDTLYNLIADTFTVYSTPGLNVNSITKETLMVLMPELTPEDANAILQVRDDKDVGKPWTDANDFWNTVKSVSSGEKALSEIQDRFTKGGLNIITTEKSFRISVEGSSGLSTRRVEAFVTLGPAPSPTPNPAGAAQAASQPAGTVAGQNAPAQTNTTAAQLIYWRSI